MAAAANTETLNDAIIMGRLVGVPQYNDHEGCMQFTIRTTEGSFFIKAYGIENYRVCERLEEGGLTTVIGSLHSYVGKKCHSHHVYIKAKTLIPHDESPAFQHLITLLGAQAIYRSRDSQPDPVEKELAPEKMVSAVTI